MRWADGGATYHCLVDVDGISLGVLVGDGVARRLVADERALFCSRSAVEPVSREKQRAMPRLGAARATGQRVVVYLEDRLVVLCGLLLGGQAVAALLIHDHGAVEGLRRRVLTMLAVLMLMLMAMLMLVPLMVVVMLGVKLTLRMAGLTLMM